MSTFQDKKSDHNLNNSQFDHNQQSNISGQHKIRFVLPTPRKPITSWHKSKMLAWEFFGTAIFAYGICSSNGDIFISSALLAGILITAPFSGGHLNPSVSFSFFIKGQIGPFDFLFRSIGQVFGSFFGAFMSFVVLNKVNGPVMSGIEYHWKQDGETLSEYLFDQWSVSNAAMGEFLGTFFLCFVILLMTDNRTTLIEEEDKKKKTVMTIFVIVLCFHVARAFTPKTGGSINPAIGFSLTVWHAIYVGDYEQLKPIWIYVITPFIGSLIAGLYYKFIHLPLVNDEDIISEELQDKYRDIREQYVNNNKQQQQSNDIELNNMELKTPLKDN